MKRIPLHFSWILLILLLVTGVACSLPRPTLPNGFGIKSSTPTLTPFLPSETPVPYENCYWNWATEPLPDLSAQVQAAMDAAGIKGITAIAEAFGENCFNTKGEVVQFAVMETDFRISLQVQSLSDRIALGNVLEEILIVLDGFPTEATPGPAPGYIGVTFQTSDDELRLWFLFSDGESARALGLHGAALLDELQYK
jgi:hypothetical protein